MNTSQNDHRPFFPKLCKYVYLYSVHICTLHIYQTLLPFTSCYISVNHRFPFLVEQDVVNCCDIRVACSMTLNLTRAILIYVQQDATLHSLFYLETALHVSGGTTTHHQERKLYLQHLVFVRPLLLPAASGR